MKEIIWYDSAYWHISNTHKENNESKIIRPQETYSREMIVYWGQIGCFEAIHLDGSILERMVSTNIFHNIIIFNIFQSCQIQKEHTVFLDLTTSQSDVKSHLSWPTFEFLDFTHAVQKETSRDLRALKQTSNMKTYTSVSNTTADYILYYHSRQPCWQAEHFCSEEMTIIHNSHPFLSKIRS